MQEPVDPPRSAPPRPPLDEDPWAEAPETGRRGFGLFSLLVVIVAMVAGLLVFGLLTGIGDQLAGISPGSGNGSPTATRTATVTVGATEATPAPAPTRRPAPAPAADVPAPPNAELIQIVSEALATGTRAEARYTSWEQVTSIQNFYLEEMPRRGWSRQADPVNGVLLFTRLEDGVVRRATIELTPAGATTQVLVSVILPRNK